jgi:class 3 adenylate cyclase
VADAGPRTPVAPRTRYASRGDLDIAYQILGEGTCDVVVMPGPFIPIDSIDSEPSMYRFFRRLSSFCRVIRFDHRGMGMSSRIGADKITPNCWAEDVVTVLDALGLERATIFASGFTSMSAIILATEHPERVSGLVIVNGSARALRAPGYDIGTELRGASFYTTIAIEPDAVEQGFDVLGVVAPSVAGDRAFRAWWDSAGNRAASPSMARRSNQSLAEADVRERLPKIAAPTLIVHRRESAFIPVGHGRYLAEHIGGANYVELDGADTLYWVGDSTPVLDEVEEFITGTRGGAAVIERMLTTIVFTDIVGSTERAAALGDDRWRDLLDNHDRIVRHELERFRGREVNTAGDGFVATFSSPSVALDCAEAIVAAVRLLGIEVRVGVHAGEVEVRGEDIAGMAVHIAARVAGLSGASEVLVSSTVREIVTGSRRTFTDHGEHALKGVPGTWRLWAL